MIQSYSILWKYNFATEKLSCLVACLANTVAVSALKLEEKRSLRKLRRKYEGNMAVYLKETKCESFDWINVA